MVLFLYNRWLSNPRAREELIEMSEIKHSPIDEILINTFFIYRDPVYRSYIASYGTALKAYSLLATTHLLLSSLFRFH